VGVLIIAVLRNGLNLLNVNSALQTFTIGAVIIIAVFIDVLRQKVMKAK
jgi:ribose transport system permease protein